MQTSNLPTCRKVIFWSALVIAILPATAGTCSSAAGLQVNPSFPSEKTPEPQSQTGANVDVKTGYANVNGLKMYYEIRGSGRPIVLLHGGCSTIETSFGKVLNALAKSRQIIGVEQQGHGHTADIERPMTFEQMADDTAELLKQLKVKKADVLGYSDGGSVAIGIAVRHPDLVRKLVVVGTNYNPGGYYPEVLEFRKNAKPEDVPAELQAAYAKVAPDPNHWPEFVSKVSKMGIDFDGWSSEQIKSIASPTLVMIGDSDFVRPEHAVEMFRLLPHAQLAIVPGADHGVLDQRPEWVRSMLEAFLNAPMPDAK